MCAWYDESGILSRSLSRSPLLTLGLAQLMQCLQGMRGYAYARDKGYASNAFW